MPAQQPRPARVPRGDKPAWERVLLRCGAVAGAVVALIALGTIWSQLNLPTIAWSQDVERLESQQLDTAIEVFQQKERSLTINKGEVERLGNGPSREGQYIEEELGETRRSLDQLRSRKIELSR